MRRCRPITSFQLEIMDNKECVHRPERCCACGAPLSEGCEQHASTARYEIELVQPGKGDTFFIVGKRSRELLQSVLGESFAHWLMSDGYGVYRDYLWRLRCLAHITRKARGLEQSLNREASRFGAHVPNVLATVMDVVYRARGSPPGVPLRETHAQMLAALFAACLENADSKHEKSKAIAREMLTIGTPSGLCSTTPNCP